MKECIYCFSERVELARYINTMETSHNVRKLLRRRITFTLCTKIYGAFLFYFIFVLKVFLIVTIISLLSFKVFLIVTIISLLSSTGRKSLIGMEGLHFMVRIYLK